MPLTRAFKSGASQAIRIPAELVYEDTSVDLTITRLGDVIVIAPRRVTMRETIANCAICRSRRASKIGSRSNCPSASATNTKLGESNSLSVFSTNAVMAGLVPVIHAVDQARILVGDPARLCGGACAKLLPLLQSNRVDGRDKSGHDG